jgi:antitoxin component YwqK of YwqJK toxin-antitoxin module
MKLKYLLIITLLLGVIMVIILFPDSEKSISIKGIYEPNRLIVNERGDTTILTYFENGRIRSENEIKNGVRDGLQKVYYSNGQLKYITIIFNGEPWVVSEFYSISGDSLFPGTLFFGKGSVYDYYDNGKINTIGYYKNSRRDSVWTYYNSKEMVTRQEFYKDGILKETIRPKSGESVINTK